MENEQHGSRLCDLLLKHIPMSQIPKLIEMIKSNESWWDRNVDARMSEFKQWVGDTLSPSKVSVRKHVAGLKYQSILDCGCGLCSEYHGYKFDEFDIAYTGLDQCKKLVEKSLSEGIKVVHGSIEDIPFPENSFDVSFARHVLEHLWGYDKALSEMIRTASKEVIVVFFIPPLDTVPASSDHFGYDAAEGIWHNTYQKTEMESFILSNPKVERIEWTPLPALNESALHLYLKPSTQGSNTQDSL